MSCSTIPTNLNNGLGAGVKATLNGQPGTAFLVSGPIEGDKFVAPTDGQILTTGTT